MIIYLRSDSIYMHENCIFIDLPSNCWFLYDLHIRKYVYMELFYWKLARKVKMFFVKWLDDWLVLFLTSVSFIVHRKALGHSLIINSSFSMTFYIKSRNVKCTLIMHANCFLKLINLQSFLGMWWVGETPTCLRLSEHIWYMYQ